MALTAGSLEKNTLEKFASFNCIFTLAALTPTEVNFPDNTYRNQNPEVMILRSGGGLGNSKVTTAFEIAGKVEYFINDVDIDSVISPNKLTGVSTATHIKFKVHEPYSMGLFINSLQIAALQAGYTNHFETPYLLKLEFKGYDSDNSTYTPERSTRYFPIRITNVQFNVSAGGAIYDIEAIAWNDSSFSDQVTSIKTDASITGSNLREILQTGTRSLRAVINDRLNDLAKSRDVPIPDQIIFAFPQTNKKLLSSQLYNITNNATVTPDSNQFNLKYYRSDAESGKFAILRELDIDSNENISSTLAYNAVVDEAYGVSNNIGDAKISQTILDSGLHLMGIDAIELTETNNANNPRIYSRGKLEISEDLRNFQFKQGSDIVSIIEELITLSTYAEDNVINGPGVNNRYKWFRIETETYINPKMVNVTTNVIPKVHVFKIIEYEVGTDHFKNTTAAMVDINERARNAVKEYNYIYTGKNKDILDFDIELKYTYFKSISSDIFQSTGGQSTSASSNVSARPSETLGLATGSGESFSDQTSLVDEYISGHRSSQTVFMDQKIAIARNFHNTIVNSDADLLQLNLKIMGDPYYLADSGIGNYISEPTGENINDDGSINYQPSEVDVIVNFRTPVDYKMDSSGQMSFPEQIIDVAPLSGLYRVIKVRNSFSGNVFTQELELLRRNGQETTGTRSGQNMFENKAESFVEGIELGSIGNKDTVSEVQQDLLDRFKDVTGLSQVAGNLEDYVEGAFGSTALGVSNAIGNLGQSIETIFNEQVVEANRQYNDALQESFRNFGEAPVLSNDGTINLETINSEQESTNTPVVITQGVANQNVQ